MPVCLIEGPTLSKSAKEELIEKALKAIVNAYKMVDDRVYINEYQTKNYGDTPHEMKDQKWNVQSQAPRIVCSIIAPPGLDVDSERTMFKDFTEAVVKVYDIKDKRDISIFLNEHPLQNLASNGYIQTENPAFLFTANEN